jgi:hypothetical protein
MRRTLTIVVAGLLAATMLVPTAAQARTAKHRGAAKADRNRDGLPDRWERRHRLSLNVKQARRDPDRDGLNNLREYRAKTHPRKADTDGDGVRDGAEVRYGLNPRHRDSDHDGVGDGHEQAGRIDSFEEGILTISLAAGGQITGLAGEFTNVRCKTPDAPVKTEYDGDDPADDGVGEELVDDLPGRDVPAGDGKDDGDGDEVVDGDGCTTAHLVPGALVREASMKLTDGQALFREITLAK